MTLIPHALMFKTRQRLLPLERVPKKTGSLSGLSEKYRLNSLAAIDGATIFADVGMGWHREGVQISVTIAGKKLPVRGDASKWETSDSIQVWIDTRNTPGVHRANRFCQSFVAVPSEGKPTADAAAVRRVPIPRAKESPPAIDAGGIRCESERQAGGYELNLWLPAGVLHGYDPEHSPVLGFFYAIQDSELGLQTAGVSKELPYASDPTLWQSVELSDKK